MSTGSKLRKVGGVTWTLIGLSATDYEATVAGQRYVVRRIDALGRCWLLLSARYEPVRYPWGDKVAGALVTITKFLEGVKAS